MHTKTLISTLANCPALPPYMKSEPKAYFFESKGASSESEFGSVWDVSCCEGYFATPPTFEGISESSTCKEEAQWSDISFRCVPGLAVNSNGTEIHTHT